MLTYPRSYLGFAIAACVLAVGCGAGTAASRSSVGEVLSPEARLAAEQTVQRDAEAMVRAMGRGDVDGLLDRTHPKAIDMFGGRDAVAELMRQMLADNERLQMTVAEVTFPQPPDLFAVGERGFALVPVRFVFVSGAAELRNWSFETIDFHLGVLEAGAAQWKYVGGSRLNHALLAQIFPDFPADKPLPPVSRRRLPR